MTNGGLYKNIRMTVRQADVLILVSIVVLIVVMALTVSSAGFTVSFDTNGGSEIKSVRLFYGEKLPEISPQKSGYVFDGWYRDSSLSERFDFKTDKITDSLVLYAGWKESAK